MPTIPQMPPPWPPCAERSSLERIRSLLARHRWLRSGVTLFIVLVLLLAGLTMLHYVVARAVVHTAADRAAQTAAEIGGDATTRKRDEVVAAAQAALPGWVGLHTDASQVQVVCSSPCLRHSPMTVSVDAEGRYWLLPGLPAHIRVSAHATRLSMGDQHLVPTALPVALLIATPLPTEPTRTPDPTRTPAPTATPNFIPTGLPEPRVTATLPPTPVPAAPVATTRPPAPAAPPPPPAPPSPTAIPAPADLSVRSGGARFDPDMGLVVVSILVINEGDSPAEGTLVQNLIPDGINLVDSTVPYIRNGQETTWDLGTVAPQATRLIIALLQPGALETSGLTHRVSVTSQAPEQRTDNNQTSVTVTW